jgi:hypothetical protein
MAEFKIGRLRFNWKGEWTPSTDYIKDDVVRYGGNSFVIKETHTSSTNFYDDYGSDPTDLKVTVARNTGDTADVFYINGREKTSINLRQGRTYIFNQDDASNVSGGASAMPLFISDTDDGTNNDGIRYSGRVTYYIDRVAVTEDAYISSFSGASRREVRITIDEFTPASLFYFANGTASAGAGISTASKAKLELMLEGKTFYSDWTVNTGYKEGDIVVYNANVYVCIQSHSSAATETLGLEADQQNWKKIVQSNNWIGSWTGGTRYIVNDIITYGPTVYRCTTAHTASTNFTDDSANWEIVLQESSYRNDWITSRLYRVNEVVKFGGTLWKSNAQHLSTTFQNDLSNWDVYIDGLEFDNAWSASAYYQIGDVVRYGGYSYRAVRNNVNIIPLNNTDDWQSVYESYLFSQDWSSEAAYAIGTLVRYKGYLYEAVNDSTGFEPPDPSYWKVIIPGREWTGLWVAETDYKLGDLATYGSNTYECILAHTSTAGNDRPDNDYGINDTYWKMYVEGDVNNVMTEQGDIVTYQSGNVRLGRGGEDSALRVANSGTELEWDLFGNTQDIYYVSPNGIDEIDQGTTPNSAFKTIKYALEYISNNRNVETKLDLSKDVIAYAILKKGALESFTTAPNLGAILDETNPNTGFAYGDVTGNGSINSSDAQGYLQWYNYHISGISSDAPSEGVRAACEDLYNRLSASRADIIDETFEWSGDNYDLVTTSIKEATLFVKTGLYKEILPLRVPELTAVVGDELRSTVITPASSYESTDMFYLRNGAGLRNCTLQGLNDVLSDASEYLTRRPSNDVKFVSLDPGAGPTDETVWITSRSPYVQNVSVFGTGVTGLKVDGNLHNGGNDSIVANDFTQVISDGIGMWITNQGRAELVSVFTYYCHIGYLAEAGGKIRGTNGNNSYGDYGSVSEGVAVSETPITGVVDNYYQDAQIPTVFTNGNEILHVEYSNAGVNYNTSASYTLTGSGTNAAVSSSNVVDGGIFEVRLTVPDTDTVPGGTSYLTVNGNAQSGTTGGTVQISNTDENEFSNYEGMRLIITSGAGAGQYGYITAYNTETKFITIAKESDDSQGWDTYGTASIVAPDTTSKYVIEPRVVVSSGTAHLRVGVASGRLSGFRIVNPGSGYSVISPPTVTITDPNVTSTGTWEVRVGDGVLAQPTFSDRGSGYIIARATVSGVGYADSYQSGKYLYVSNLTLEPGPGANVQIDGNDEIFRLVKVEQITGTAPNISARLWVSPAVELFESPEDNVGITIRENYSQVRLTGHDFLDIGLGSFEDTNYPFTVGREISQENEVLENGGGRVFYTSTDQDGNFRVGELFKVEQATGIVTLNAESFDLGGLTELRLGGVILGGTGAVVREFSTDSTFSANSNNIVPTQRAIATFIQSRIGGGGADVNVNQISMGQITISGADISASVPEIEFTSKPIFKDGTLDQATIAYAMATKR